MKKNKKALPVGTDFRKKHEPLIRGGNADVVMGWVNAGVECLDKFRGNASAYAKASVNGFTVSQTESTIRQYVGAVVAGLRKYGSASALLSAYDKVYEAREMSALRSFVAGSGQRKKGDKKPSQAAVALTKRAARSAWDKSRSFDEFWELING